MVKTRRPILYVECLEDRLPLNADCPETASDCTSEEAICQPVDTTEEPVDNSNMSITAEITALGDLVDGKLQSITVSGLPSGSDSYESVTVQIGNNVYQVDFLTDQGNGEFTLTVSQGIDPEGVEVGTEVLVKFGCGDSSTSTTTDPSSSEPEDPSTVPPHDPTLEPQQ